MTMNEIKGKVAEVIVSLLLNEHPGEAREDAERLAKIFDLSVVDAYDPEEENEEDRPATYLEEWDYKKWEFKS